MSDDDVHVWLSVGKIAEQEEISKQAVSKALAKIIAEHDIPVRRDQRGRVVAVSLAHWQHHRDRFVNPAMRTSTSEGSDSFNEARRRNEWLKYDRARIEHQEAAGQLVRADLIADAAEKIGAAIQRRVNRLQNRADDLALAVSKEGAHGLRVALRQVAFDINQDIADELAELAKMAPERDPTIEESIDA